MKFVDGYRANLFLRYLESSLDNINNLLSVFECDKEDINKILSSISYNWSIEVDKIILPSITYEIHSSKELLYGCNPNDRYASFFVDGQGWSKSIIDYVQKYKFLLDRIEVYLQQASKNIENSIYAFYKDEASIKSLLQIRSEEKLNISNISILGSDRHIGGNQALLIEINNKYKLIYKPTSLLPDILFSEYVSNLELEYPFDMKTNIVLDRKEYGWLRYLEHNSCNSMSEVSSFFVRAGVLLGILDSLNYCDGHFDNLFSCGEYPVLIDCETMFHYFGVCVQEYFIVDKERSVLYTGLVQKPPKKDSGRGLTAAFQTPSKYRYEFLEPYAINDHRDDLRVSFQGISSGIGHNLPTLKGVSYGAKSFINQIIFGYSAVYKRILSLKQSILDNKNFWSRVSVCKCRQIVRSTMYYKWMMRKMEQPDLSMDINICKESIKQYFIDEESSSSCLFPEEFSEMIDHNIPYFYHYPNASDIYSGYGTKYNNYLGGNSLKEIRYNISHMSESLMNRNIDILKNVLPYSPDEYQSIFRI